MAEQRIRLLDETTINQIAAGEVVENPASVVKELVENALDSRASSISIETRGGGRGLIRVSDDGCGMDHDDLVLAMERHATSKLSEIEDLNSLVTLGFRGEALPSIASVSKISIHSASREEGYMLRAEGGRMFDLQVKPRRQGTTVEVRSLFFNVPVRKKFQKSVGWDRSEIHKVLTKMILCHWNVAFSWISEGEEQFSIPADFSLEDRVALLLGTSNAEGMLPVEHAKGSLSLEGFLSRPFLHRPNRTGQYLFINKRAVISPFVSRKVQEGYGTRLSTHRFPLFVLHFTIPSSQIDVNVHPQKKEVRLRNEEEIGSFIIEAVEKIFLPEKMTVPLAEMPTFAVSEQPAPYFPPIKTEKNENAQPDLFPFFPRVISRMGNYLFLEDPKGIRIVDCKRSRMRVAYEQIVLREKKNAVQHLLIPIQIEAAGAEKIALMENLPLFEEVGFSIRHFGENTFIIDAIPSFLEGDEVEAFVYAFLEREDLPREKKIAAALQKSVKTQGREGEKALVEALYKCKEPEHAPNGKPTQYLLTEKEIERLF
jgi:DNA mismatch repair protein MutL